MSTQDWNKLSEDTRRLEQKYERLSIQESSEIPPGSISIVDPIAYEYFFRPFHYYDRFYQFYYSSSALYYRHSADGINWSDRITVTTGTQSSYDIFFKNGYIEYSKADSQPDNADFKRVWYRKGQVQGNGSISWLASEQFVVVGYLPGGGHWTAITRNNSGYAFIFTWISTCVRKNKRLDGIWEIDSIKDLHGNLLILESYLPNNILVWDVSNWENIWYNSWIYSGTINTGLTEFYPKESVGNNSMMSILGYVWIWGSLTVPIYVIDKVPPIDTVIPLKITDYGTVSDFTSTPSILYATITKNKTTNDLCIFYKYSHEGHINNGKVYSRTRISSIWGSETLFVPLVSEGTGPTKMKSCYDVENHLLMLTFMSTGGLKIYIDWNFSL